MIKLLLLALCTLVIALYIQSRALARAIRRNRRNRELVLRP